MTDTPRPTAPPAADDGTVGRLEARIRHLSNSYALQRDKLLAQTMRADHANAHAEQLAKANDSLLLRLEQAAARGKHAAIAEVVATYWRDEMMDQGGPLAGASTHPLAIVLSAFAGVTDPAELGIDHGAPGSDRVIAAIRELAAL